MLGLRLEQQKITDSTGAQLIKSTTFSPRLQVRYDIKGDSRDLITATAAQFQGDIPQSFVAAFATHPQSSGVYMGFNNINGTVLPAAGTANDNFTPDGVNTFGVAGDYYGVRFVPWSVIENPNNYKVPISTFDNSKTNIVDSSLKPPTMNEVTLGYSHSYQDGSFFSLTYVGRTWSNLWAIGYNYDPSQVVNISPDQSWGIQKHFFNSSDLKRNYNGLEMVWDIKTKSIWSINGSWSYSRLTGNDEQGDDATGNSTIMNTNPTPLFFNNSFLQSKGVPTSVYAPDGRLLNDLSNRIRLGITATVPLSKGGVLTFNWMAHYIAGAPFGAVNFGNTSSINLSSYGLPTVYAGPGNTNPVAGSTTINGYVDGRRNYEQNSLAGVDFRTAWRIPLPLWKMQLIGDVTISNFFNHIDTGYNTSFNTAFPNGPTGSPVITLPPGFGANGANGDPRQVRSPPGPSSRASASSSKASKTVSKGRGWLPAALLVSVVSVTTGASDCILEEKQMQLALWGRSCRTPQ